MTIESQQFVKERIDFITDDWYFPREHELGYDELEPEPTMLLEVFSREEGIDDNILNNVKKLLEEHTKNR